MSFSLLVTFLYFPVVTNVHWPLARVRRLLWLLPRVLTSSGPVSSPLCTRSRIYISKMVGFAHFLSLFLRCTSEYSSSRDCLSLASGRCAGPAAWPASRSHSPRLLPENTCVGGTVFCCPSPQRPCSPLNLSLWFAASRAAAHRLHRSRKTCSVKLLFLFGELRRQYMNHEWKLLSHCGFSAKQMRKRQ